MRGAVKVAVAAAIGNLLQGWDNATIAGALLYVKKEFKLENEPTVEGLIVAMSLIGATCITTCSGAISDWIGRRPLLIISSVLYFLSGLVMIWSPNVYILLLGRLLDGFGVGLAVTLVPVYISETAPAEIRGSLNTLPQFTGSAGMFLSYCMVFRMSLMTIPNWRLMLGVLSIPSLLYFALTVFFLPESPRWLVSKGRMSEAKKVLQMLHGRDDVDAEMALLVKGLGVGGETSREEYIIAPANGDIENLEISADRDRIKLHGTEQGTLGLVSPIQSALGPVDPVVNILEYGHEKLSEIESLPSAFLPHFGSMFNVGGNRARNGELEEEEDCDARQCEDYSCNGVVGISDYNLHSPLISRQTTGVETVMVPHANGVFTDSRHDSLIQGNGVETVDSTGFSGGWKLLWKWYKKENKEGGLKRINLHQEGSPGATHGSLVALPGADAPVDNMYVKAAALVSDPAETVKARSWNNIFEPGVKHALRVGVGIQMLQQFSGINGVLYYTPQILEQAGVGFLLSNRGISSSSASLLISGITTLLMLPSIAVGMRLMDAAGRRSLLLSTIPVLLVSLIILVIGTVLEMGNIANAALSTIGVTLYFCVFVLGFGPIPNIICAEIFPTRVGGTCIAICALMFWICNIIVTYTLPLLLDSVGLVGIFSTYAIVCFLSWVFVYFKVPETKGIPLEIITNFFSVDNRS